jgi:hypothetical protein
MRTSSLKGSINWLPILPLVISSVYTSPLYAKTWAAQFQYGSELSPVFHAHSPDKVLIEAIAFCKQNELCKSKYTDADIKSVLVVGVVGFANLFVTTLCKKNSGENIYVTVPSPLNDAAGREDGLQKGRDIAQEAGLSVNDCLIHAVYGVKSRKRLKTDLEIREHEPVSQGTGEAIRLYRLQRRNSIWTASEILD